MSETKVFRCPNCGSERPKVGGAYCENCGAQLIDIGKKPGLLGVPAAHPPRDRHRRVVYAKMRSVGYSSWWQTEGMERKIVTAIMYALMILLFIAVVAMFMGNVFLFLILFAVVFLGFIATAVISGLRPKNRQQIKEHGVSYGGKIDVKRDLRTGEITDHSEIDIHYKEQ